MASIVQRQRKTRILRSLGLIVAHRCWRNVSAVIPNSPMAPFSAAAIEKIGKLMYIASACADRACTAAFSRTKLGRHPVTWSRDDGVAE
jgi:hypothetical protein